MMWKRPRRPVSRDGRWVVLVDHERWHVLEQISAVVRRQGGRTLRLSTTPSTRATRVLDRLVYSRSRDIASKEDFLRAVKGLDIIALHLTETALDRIDDSAFEGLSQEIAGQIRQMRIATNKAETAKLAIAAGLDAPQQLSALSTGSDDAIALLGLPLVIKTKIGASGEGVIIAHTPDDVSEGLGALGDASNIFLEQFHDGDHLSYSAIAGKSGIVQELTYQAVTEATDATSVPLAMMVVDDPDLLEIGRQVATIFGLSGPFNLQTIRDDDGRHWLIDLNPRPFGPMLSFDQEQIDTIAGYLYSIGLRTEPPRVIGPPVGAIVRGFPYEAEDLAAQGRYGAAARSFFAEAPRFVRTMGLRYLIFVVASRVTRRFLR